MKILQIITDRQLRGAQVFAVQLADWLQGQGHEVLLATLYKSEVEPLKSEKIQIIDLSGTKKSFSLSLTRKLRKVIIDFSPAVIQANGSDTLKYAVVSLTGLRLKPVIVYRNISMAGSWIRSVLHRKIYKLLFGRVDHVASLTATTKDEFISVYRFPAEKISIIPVGVEESESTGTSRQTLVGVTGAPAGSVFIVHIGAFSKEKNHEGLLRIFAQVKEAIPNVVLVLVGNGSLFTAIQDLATPLAPSVFFLGARTDVRDWLGDAYALFLPSLIEGLPGVVLEAMASKVPVVAYDVGSVGDVVLNGRTGFTVPVGNEHEFVHRALQLLRDEDLRAQMAREGLARIRNGYLLSNICRRFEEVYTNAIDRRK